MKKPKINARINLEELAGGAFAEKLNEALVQVAENIQNPNTEATTKRQITINIKFAPNKTRQIVGTTIAVTTKLAATEAIDTQMVMGINMRTGQVEIAEYDGQIRGQMNLSTFMADADTKEQEKATQQQEDAPAAVQEQEAAPTGKPLDLRNRNRQQAAATPKDSETAFELVPGRDYDPETGEVLEKGAKPTDDHRTDHGQTAKKPTKAIIPMAIGG